MSEVKLMVGQKWKSNDGSEVEIMGPSSTSPGMFKGRINGKDYLYHENSGVFMFGGSDYHLSLKTLIFCPSWPVPDGEVNGVKVWVKKEGGWCYIIGHAVQGGGKKYLHQDGLFYDSIRKGGYYPTRTAALLHIEELNNPTPKESPVLDLNNHKVGDKFNSHAWGEGEIVAKRRDLWIVFYNQNGNTASLFQDGKVLGAGVLHGGDLVSVVKKTVVMWVVRWGEDGKYCGVYDKQTEAEAAARLSSSPFAIKKVEVIEGEGLPLPPLPEEKKWVVRVIGGRHNGLYWKGPGCGTTALIKEAYHYSDEDAQKEKKALGSNIELIPAPLA